MHQASWPMSFRRFSGCRQACITEPGFMWVLWITAWVFTLAWQAIYSPTEPSPQSIPTMFHIGLSPRTRRRKNSEGNKTLRKHSCELLKEELQSLFFSLFLYRIWEGVEVTISSQRGSYSFRGPELSSQCLGWVAPAVCNSSQGSLSLLGLFRHLHKHIYTQIINQKKNAYTINTICSEGCWHNVLFI